MKNLVLTFAFTLSCCFAYSQKNDFQALLDSGKAAFKKQDTTGYTKALNLLTKAVNLRPEHAEAKYFLGYTLDRLNAEDGSSINLSKKELTLQASEQFEMVNKLQEEYTGEIIVLDPYTKIAAIWGSLAQAYLTKNLPDSAKWAFNEGKKRGGFIKPVLEYNRQLLNSCEKGAILVTQGDIITITCWYLQTTEQFRTDITVVDAGLLNTIWYPKYLKTVGNLKLSIPDSEMDSINYIPYKPTKITIADPNDPARKFTWTLKPTYYDQYILRGDRLMLDMMKQNLFSRKIYFSIPADSSYNLFLDDSFMNAGLVTKVMLNRNELSSQLATASKNLAAYNINKISTADINKSVDARRLLEKFRWAYFSVCKDLYGNGKGQHATALKLLQEMELKFDDEKLPYQFPPLKGAIDELKEALSPVK